MKTIATASLLLAALGGCDANGNGVGDDRASEPALPAMNRFVNSRANARSEALQLHYVDFSFEYPADWQMAKQTPGDQARNYVNLIAAAPPGRRVPYAINFGHAFGTGNAESDRVGMAQALPAIAQRFGQGWTDYRITSTGEGRVGRYPSYNWRFSARTSDAGAVPVYGRGDIVLPAGSTRGLLIVSLATGASEVRSPIEVGESGPIKAIHDSLELATVPPAPEEQ